MLSERLRLLRSETGMSQTDLAKKVGLSMRGYQDLERGVMPRSSDLVNIAELYDVSIDWLLGRTEKRSVNR